MPAVEVVILIAATERIAVSIAVKAIRAFLARERIKSSVAVNKVITCPTNKGVSRRISRAAVKGIVAITPKQKVLCTGAIQHVGTVTAVQ